jgi:hydroxypyruvate isomerase
MPRFAANLSWMFTEWPFLDRFAAAADAGFGAVEFLYPYDYDPDAIGERLQRHRLMQALFNLPPGEAAADGHGLAALPGGIDAVRASVERALPYIAATGVRRVHLLAGIGERSDAASAEAYRAAVAWVADRLAPQGVSVMIEPINRRSTPGYFLDDFDYAADLVRAMALPNLQLQFDIFHCQILHGDVTTRLRALMPLIGHVQVSSVPDRHEPGTGELDERHIFAELDRLGYGGFVGCEYRPANETAAGLGWFRRYAPQR